MGPIVAVTLGTVIREWPLVRKGLRNELIGVTLVRMLGVGGGDCLEREWAPPPAITCLTTLPRTREQCLLIGFIWGLCTNQVEDFWAQQEQVRLIAVSFCSQCWELSLGVW